MKRITLLLLLAACTAADALAPESRTVATAATAPVTWTATGGTITPTGLYTAGTTPGAYRVIASAEGKADTSLVHICALAGTLTLPVHDTTLTHPDTLDLTAAVTNECAETDTSVAVTWVSRNTGIATVASTGTQTGRVLTVATGQTYIVATAGTRMDSVRVCIGDFHLVDVEPGFLNLSASGSGTLTATVSECDRIVGDSVVWVSRNTGVATVASTGAQSATVTAAGTGATYVVGTSGGASDSALVTVTSGSGEPARMADSLVETISVQTHIKHSAVYNNNFATIIKPRLIELGVRHIRQRIHDTDATAKARLIELGNAGIKLTAGCWPINGVYTNAAHCLTAADAIGTTVIDAFDGWNEVDNKLTPSTWAAAWVTWETTLFNAINASGTWASRPLYANSLAHAVSTDQLGNRSTILDYGNMHSYPAGGMPSNVSQSWIPKWTNVAKPKKLVVTETGYHTCPTCGGNGVSHTAQSKYLGRLIFEYFNRGIERTNIYQLMDEGTSTLDREDNWGLILNSGTRKASFTTIKNIITLMADPGVAFTPGNLNYTLAGALATTHKALFQKRDGRFQLVLWQEVSVWSTASKTNITNADDALTLTLGSAATAINVYKPSTGTSTIQTGSGTSIALTVPDEVIVVEIVP